jgi:transposase
MAERLVEALFTALDEQTVPRTDAAASIVPKLAKNLAALLGQCAELASSTEEMPEVHPLSELLTSMPGVGVRTGARILFYVGDESAFPAAGHLAPYSGLAPATRRSGSASFGESPSRRGNKHLKRALLLTAFASLSDPASRACFQPHASPKPPERQKNNCPTP